MADDLTTFIDHLGRSWDVPPLGKRLQPAKRPADAAIRAFVFLRDDFTCQQCGFYVVKPPERYDGRNSLYVNRRTGGGFPALLHLDHVLARSKGGSNHPSNLQTLCESCNSGKCDRPFIKRAA